MDHRRRHVRLFCRNHKQPITGQYQRPSITHLCTIIIQQHTHPDRKGTCVKCVTAPYSRARIDGTAPLQATWHTGSQCDWQVQRPITYKGWAQCRVEL